MIRVPTVDDAVRHCFENIFSSGKLITSTKGENIEIIGVQIELSNPRARLCQAESRATLYSCLGEYLWYLAQSDEIEVIQYYAANYSNYVKADESGRVVGAYGPRLFSWDSTNQVRNIIALLSERSSTKQAVIQLFDRRDLATGHPDVPCTCVLQFFLREGLLHLIVYMRSNDAVRGLPHDVFAFTMLQELVARSVSAEVGTYRHWVGSLHMYSSDQQLAQSLVAEGWQQTVGAAMSPMPQGDPWPAVDKLLEAERAFRLGGRTESWPSTGIAYWDGLIWLLEMYRHFRNADVHSAEQSWNQRPCRDFDEFINSRMQRLREQSPR